MILTMAVAHLLIKEALLQN